MKGGSVAHQHRFPGALQGGGMPATLTTAATLASDAVHRAISCARLGEVEPADRGVRHPQPESDWPACDPSGSQSMALQQRDMGSR